MFLIQAALAAETVLYAGDPSAAVEHVAADALLPVWELHPVRIADLLSDGTSPAVVGGAQPPACTGGRTTNARVRDLLDIAEKKLVRLDESAGAQFELATAALGCLAEPAEASLAGRLFFLAGLQAQDAGRIEDARVAFARAQAFQPGLAWDEHFAPDGKALFDQVATAVVAAAPTATLLLGPGLTSTRRLGIDGHEVATAREVSLAAGPHLVQTLDAPFTTFEVNVRPDHPVVLLVPSSLDDQALSQADLGTTYWQTVLCAIFDRSLGEGARLYIWDGSRVWRTGDPWVALRPSATARASAMGRALVSGGAVATVAGAAGAAIGWMEVVTITSGPALERGDPDLYRQEGRLADLLPWTIASTSLAGLGAAALVAGLVVESPSRHAVSVAPTIGPDGAAGLSLAWRE